MIELSHVYKSYSCTRAAAQALCDVTLSVGKGEYVSIIGASGSGKTTLMNIIGCLDAPTSGEYSLCGERIVRLTARKTAHLRNREIGFVFQRFHLVPGLTALDNVELPLVFRGTPPKERAQAALRALRQVGLADRASHMPGELSGGQQQRVAVARALVTEPQLLLADEPTGSLDEPSAQAVMEILEQANENGATVALITHDMALATRAPRRITIENGRITSDKKGR